MIRNVLFTLLFLPAVCIAQDGIGFNPIRQFALDTNEFRVVMVTAPWCNICKSNKRELMASNRLRHKLKGQLMFYEFSSDDQTDIVFNETVFHFTPNGPNSGSHEFLTFLFDSDEEVYPSFIIFDRQGAIVSRVSGLTNESDWLRIAENLVLRESPDSVNN